MAGLIGCRRFSRVGSAGVEAGAHALFRHLGSMTPLVATRYQSRVTGTARLWFGRRLQVSSIELELWKVLLFFGSNPPQRDSVYL